MTRTAPTHRLVPFLLLAAPLAARQDDPPARALSLELCATPRLAGTSGSLRAAEFVQRVLEEAGWRVEVDEREVLLSLPRRLELALFEDAARVEPFRERFERFDPDAVPPGDLPPFNSWTASGEARGEVIDAGWGLPEDFERLRAARIDPAGKVALCRYGSGYRGDKVRNAEEAGCVAVLLYTPAERDGAPRGTLWPRGPWKPAWEAQRGSIRPLTGGGGDPSTPGFASPAPGAALPPGKERLEGEELASRLPRILVMPIGADEAQALIDRLATRRVRGPDGRAQSVRLGPGPAVARLVIDAPRELRPIRNLIGRLDGQRQAFVLAGNHRDAWVRGAHDAGSGTVSLLRAAQHLGARARGGWRPPFGIAVAFWDAEETGLIGSTEWAEAHAAELSQHLLAYVNLDAVVSGLDLRASGTPGLETLLARALERVPQPAAAGEAAPLMGRTLLDPWLESAEGQPRFRLPGAGSDFTVFLHHLGLPVLDLAFSGGSGGYYHTAFDDFPVMDRHLDPTWQGHETAGHLAAVLLAELAELGPLAFDDAWAAGEMARHAEEAASWLGEERSRRLATAFETLARAVSLTWTEWRRREEFAGESDLGVFGTWPSFLDSLRLEANRPALEKVWDGEPQPPFYASLLRPEELEGLEGREWLRNELWSPDPENGYGRVSFPRLRAAAELGDEEALDAALDELLKRIEALRLRWQGS